MIRAKYSSQINSTRNQTVAQPWELLIFLSFSLCKYYMWQSCRSDSWGKLPAMQESLLTLKLQWSQFLKLGLTSQGTDDESVTTPCKKELSFMLRRGIQESWPTQRWHRRLLSALLPWLHQMCSYTLDNSLWKRPGNYSAHCTKRKCPHG